MRSLALCMSEEILRPNSISVILVFRLCGGSQRRFERRFIILHSLCKLLIINRFTLAQQIHKVACSTCRLHKVAGDERQKEQKPIQSVS